MKKRRERASERAKATGLTNLPRRARGGEGKMDGRSANEAFPRGACAGAGQAADEKGLPSSREACREKGRARKSDAARGGRSRDTAVLSLPWALPVALLREQSTIRSSAIVFSRTRTLTSAWRKSSSALFALSSSRAFSACCRWRFSSSSRSRRQGSRDFFWAGLLRPARRRGGIAARPVVRSSFCRAEAGGGRSLRSRQCAGGSSLAAQGVQRRAARASMITTPGISGGLR